MEVIRFDKLTSECRICERLIYNGGSCGGRKGLINICLVYKTKKEINTSPNVLERGGTFVE